MRTETTTRTLYEYSELSEAAQESAREWWREAGLHDEWWDFVYDDAKRMASILGIDIDNIFFSGFWSQGDGACFEGTYRYKPGSCKAIRAEAPQDRELHVIADTLRDIQRPWFYQLTASVKHSGNYSHEYCTVIDVEDERYANWGADPLPEDEMADALRRFMRWIYARLEEEYEWINSDENVAEAITANEYEFTEDGRRA